MVYKVLAVDSDLEHLLQLSSSLRFFKYEVTTCQTAMGALSLLRRKTNEFQIVIAEVDLPDADGFDLLAAVTSEFKSVQVVLLSSSNVGYDAAAVRALSEGACAFYTKPIPMEVVENVWQHVYRKKIESLPQPPLPIVSSVVGPVQKKRKRDNDPKSVEQGQEGKKRLRKTVKNSGAATGPKKPRLHWSPELCSKFVAAVEVIGIHNVTVGKIIRTMEKMGVVGLTEPQVSSHLQQYRKRLPLKNKSSSADSSEPSSFKETSSADTLEPSSSKETSSADPLEPSSSSKETSSAAATQNQTTSSASAVESYLSDQQLPEISSADYTTTSQQSSQTTSYGGVLVESGAEDFDWYLNLDLSFLGSESEVINNLLACC